MRVTDEELVSRINQQSDPMRSSDAALLISRYSRLIHIKAAKLRTQEIESEDLSQEGYLALFEAVRCFDKNKGSFYNFAGKCIDNRMINLVNKARGKFEKDDDFDFELIPDSAASADDYVIIKENNGEIAELLLTVLTEKEYGVLSLYLDGYSYKQIAEEMNISSKSADNALMRARKKLRELL